MTAYSAGSYPPAIPELSHLFHVSEISLTLGLTTWCVGFAIAPMILAPFSELNGRRPVIVLSGILFAVCQLCCGLTRGFAGMLVSRFFVGVGAATYGAVLGGVIADVYVLEERNTPMAFFSGSVLFGTGTGPMLSGILAEV
jgi:MFS family permease